MLKLVHLLTYPVYLFRFLQRHKTIRTGVLLTLGISAALVYAGGWQLFFLVLMYLFRLVFVIIFIVVQFVALFMFLGRTKATEVLPGDKGRVTFEDYWGQENIVNEVRQWQALLTDPEGFVEMGGEPINGLVLIGPPGTGKTYLAKALSGSGQSAFYGMDGSGFRAMFIGIDILKMRSFFSKLRKLAKEHGSAIGYLDELDAVGGTRGGVMGNAMNHIEKMVMGGMGMGASGALTRLLYELDGLEEPSLWDECENDVRAWFGYDPIKPGRIFVIGSTNRPDSLDPALTRAGRLDKMITVGMPDKSSRREIIEGYLGRIQHDDTVDLEILVANTPHVTPAQIASAITKDAVRRAFFDGRSKVSHEDIELAFQEQQLGLPNPIAEFEPEQKRQVAIHEAGHAVVAWLLREHQRLVRVSIVRRGSALGYVMPAEKEDRYTRPLEHYVRDIMVSFAGDVATDIVMGQRWTGAAGDLRNIKARVDYLAVHGYFGWFPMNIDPQTGRVQYSGEQQEELNKFLEDCVKKTKRLLEQNRAALDALTAVLLEKEDISGEEAVRVMEEAHE